MHKKGFTLVELSIVIVIIGLIIGGVMIGRDLIASAQTRKLMSQMQGIEAAINTFELKYNCVAGDCLNAAQFGLGTAGDGNGAVDGPNISPATTGGCYANNSGGCLTFNAAPPPGHNVQIFNLQGEMQYFWVHLVTAGLIAGNYQTLPISSAAVADLSPYFPRDALGNAFITVGTWGGRLYLRTGLTSIGANRYSYFERPALSSAQMFGIFSKFSNQIIVGATTYDSFYANNQKVAALGIWGGPGLTSYLWNANSTYAAVGWSTACIISDGAGGYVFNVSNNGMCNMFWRLK